ncbi:Transcriptional regulatory protein YehT [Vibrio aerogenes CECT 7868]|uniref:Transcriptional regulatory protein YehT n=1 Tax=Vibrio aerogenes CECT 7868 TaxID=1216006 RepID=A0A1M5X936_9VIBR|nr:LytTR family DNA-binding domain-containing protein [Vibrio aerogenes]SHH96309.1 Transcriptional regulatory protein YehT [Vibrio aerogenes CECT 7868]
MNHPVCAVIADDEPLLRYHLNKMLAEVWPQLEVVASCEDGIQALNQIQRLQPEIVFLDIKMPEMDGMTLAKKLQKTQPDDMPLIVFITAYDEYAVQAFEANAIDYLLKPLNEDRLMQCVDKVRQRLHSDHPQKNIQAIIDKLQQLSAPSGTGYLKWIRVQKGQEIHLIATADILYFKAEDKYVSLYKQNGQETEEFLLRTPLKELLLQLDPEQFWQIHRSTVIHVAAIEKIKRDISGKISVIIGGQKLPVSRAMQGKFLHNF